MTPPEQVIPEIIRLKKMEVALTRLRDNISNYSRISNELSAHNMLVHINAILDGKLGILTNHNL